MHDAPWNDGLHPLLARIREGVPDDQQAAKRELFARVYDRLRQLARRMLPGFPLVARSVEATDLAHDLYLGLMKAFAADHVPADEVEFDRFTAWKLRRTLLDLSDAVRVRAIVGSLEGLARTDANGYDPGTTTTDPQKLALWTRFHEEVEKLPEDERAVFELWFYSGLDLTVVAAKLGLPPRTASRRKNDAARRLRPYLPAD